MTIYLDYAATTPVDPRVAAAMAASLAAPDAQANAASSTHGAGLAVHDTVVRARAAVAGLLGAQPREIVFTSGATESNNLALLGVAQAVRRAGGAAARGHFVSSRAEHKSVLDPLRQLEREGFAVTLLEPDEWGRVGVDAVRTALRPDTLLVSLMHSNNELGCITDLQPIAQLCRERGVLLHTDASQSVGKWGFTVEQIRVDLLSLSAHKFHGPKGIGALYVRESARARLAPILHGGGHERGMRSGTLATHQIVGLGTAAEIAGRERERDATHVGALRVRLTSHLESMPGVSLNTLPGDRSLPGIVNASFEGVEGESLVTGLSEIAVSTGSACSSATREPSYVLRALGRDPQLAQSSLRLSFGRFTTEAEIDTAGRAIRREYSRLLELAGSDPLPADGFEPGRRSEADETSQSLLGRTLNPLARHYFLAPARPLLRPGDAPAAGLRSGRAGDRPGGTEVRFELEHSQTATGDRIVKSARFAAYGCPHTLAVTAWLCEVLEGTRPEAGPPGTPHDWAGKFAVPVEKLGRLLVVEDALRAALAA